MAKSHVHCSKCGDTIDIKPNGNNYWQFRCITPFADTFLKMRYYICPTCYPNIGTNRLPSLPISQRLEIEHVVD